MAIKTTLPVRVGGSIIDHTPDIDIENKVIPNQFRVRFVVEDVNGLSVQSQLSGYFLVPEARLPYFPAGQYHWIGYMDCVSYFQGKLGLTHLRVNSEIFEVSDA